MLPRIPFVSSVEDFWAFSNAGRKLADLHLNYETIEPWPLKEEINGDPNEDIEPDSTGDDLRLSSSGIISDKILKSRKKVVFGGTLIYLLTWIPLVWMTSSMSPGF